MKEALNRIKAAISGFESKHKMLSFLIVSLIISFFMVIGSSAISSFFYPHMRADVFTNDAQFFYLTGLMIKNGAKPYIDINDHKGLYVFLYEALAVSLGGRFGMFIFEFIFTSVEVFFFQLIFDEFKTSRRLSITMILIFALIGAAMYQYNNTEEIQLVWLFPGIYFYIRGFMRQSERSFMIGNICWGVQTGITFNIRASDILFAFAMVCFYAFYMFRRKKYLIVLRDAGIFLAAFFVSAAPAYIIAWANGYLVEMWNSAIIANISYVNGLTSDTAHYDLLLVVLFISLFAYLHFTNIRYMRKDEWMFFLINYVIIGLYELMIAKFSHYWIMCFPMIIINAGRVLSLRKLDRKALVSKGLCYFSILGFLIAFSAQPILYYEVWWPQDSSMSQYVKSSIGEEDRAEHTLMIDCTAGNYISCGITPHHKDFTMQTWHSHFEENVIVDLKAYLESGDCKYVVINVTSTGEIRNYIQSNFDLLGSKSDNPYCDIYIKR